MALPSDDTLKWLISRYAAVLAAAGDAFEGAELVTPTGEHFPDRFERDGESVARLVRRMTTYTPLSEDLELQVAFFEADEAEESGGGCGSCGPTSCGPKKKSAPATSRVDAIRNGYKLSINVADTSNPVILTSTVARCLGAMVLTEAELDDVEEIAAESEIAAAACGFGVLMSAASHVYGKSCGGVSIRRSTALSLEESTLMLALFCAVSEVKPSKARAHLEPSQREALAESIDLLSCNPKIIAALREAPETLADGHFAIAREKGLFGRLFSRNETPELDAPVKRRAPMSEDEKRRLAEAKALVEEALSES
jgi:hypothetical protein